MKILVLENYEQMSLAAADLITAQVKEKPDSVLGLATGGTPVGTYKVLVERYQRGELDFSKITTFNLDEYYPIKPDDTHSYRYFMNDNLFNHINVPESRIHIPNGEAEDAELECANYEKMLDAAGGIDLQILGIGLNGHIAFNEPDETLVPCTHKTPLTESTLEANARFFTDGATMPDSALTMGMASIFRAKKILLLANGAGKREILTKLVRGGITTSVPASLLLLHPDVTIICDKDAAPKD